MAQQKHIIGRAQNYIVGVEFVSDSSEACYPATEQTLYIEVYAGSAKGAIEAVEGNKEAVLAHMHNMGDEHLEINRIFDATDKTNPRLIDIIHEYESTTVDN